MLPNVGTWEMIIILLVIFLVFGPKRLPGVARGLGRGLREFKREMRGITDELNDIVDDESSDTPKKGMSNNASTTTEKTPTQDEEQ